MILLQHLFLNLQEDSVVQRPPSAGAFKSCSYLEFTVQAATISRKINYGVTQSSPEGGARLHAAKNRSTLFSLTTQNKTRAAELE